MGDCCRGSTVWRKLRTPVKVRLRTNSRCERLPIADRTACIFNECRIACSLTAIASFEEVIETFTNPFRLRFRTFSRGPLLWLLFRAVNDALWRAGSRDDLGDFSKDNLQEALGNANLLLEKGTPCAICFYTCVET